MIKKVQKLIPWIRKIFLNEKKVSTTIFLKRDSLENIPEYPLPEGYAIRKYQGEEDRKIWLDIINSSYNQEYTEEYFDEQLPPDVFSPERLIFVTYKGKPVGTIAAWWRPAYGEKIGYPHMMGVVPEHRGKKLGHILLAEALKTLKELGYEAAANHTDSFRIPAIRSHLKLGYKPLLETPEQAELWKEIGAKLGIDFKL